MFWNSNVVHVNEVKGARTGFRKRDVWLTVSETHTESSNCESHVKWLGLFELMIQNWFRYTCCIHVFGSTFFPPSWPPMKIILWNIIRRSTKPAFINRFFKVRITFEEKYLLESKWNFNADDQTIPSHINRLDSPRPCTPPVRHFSRKNFFFDS